jgi:glycosyl-4,4'-diaponeurosporenoate acyltransferase
MTYWIHGLIFWKFNSSQAYCTLWYLFPVFWTESMGSSKDGFSDLEIASMKSEFGHFFGFCTVMIITIIIGIKASFLQAILILIVNIFFNFYPFMLQRFHRLRLNELKSRFRVGMV